MKKYYAAVLLIISFLNSFCSLSSSRFPLNPSTIWRVDHIRNGVSDENNHVEGDEILKYFINGDTVINSLSYYKIYKTGTKYLNAPFYYENLYTGAIRDFNNKFLYIKKNESNEIPLYDFNVKVDDTIQVPYEGSFEEKIVSSIDSLSDGRRIIHFNPKEPIIGCGDQYYIEGIGGSGGLLEGPACNHFWTFDNHLVCFVQNDQLVYHDYNFEFNCEIIDYTDKSLDTTGIWRVNTQISTDSLSNFEKLEYFFMGDTLINSKKYQKLYKNGFQLNFTDFTSYTAGFNDTVYMGAFRKDNKRLYFIARNQEKEELLYNFNLNAGQINDGLIFMGDTVKSTDTIIDNRKVIYFDNNLWGKKVMEGIGTDFGLIEDPAGYSNLICYRSNIHVIYNSGSGADCGLSYTDYNNFNECDRMKIIPAHPLPTDNIRLVTRTCYVVPFENPVIPVLSDKTNQLEFNEFDMNLYYEYNHQTAVDNKNILVPVFDTTELGTLEAGQYFISLKINTIHRINQEVDTAFYEKGNYFSFKVSSSTSKVPDDLSGNSIIIYPLPAHDYLTLECSSSYKNIKSVEFYTLIGSKVATYKINETGDLIHKIYIGDREKGFYLVTIRTENCSITKRILIQ